MDILNWLYLVKNKFVRTTPSSQEDLLVLGANVGFSKRGDRYQNYALSIGDFTADIISTLGTESGTYVPAISESGGAIITDEKGFYIKIGNIVQVTISFLFSGAGVAKSFRISTPISGGDFTNSNQAAGVFMRYDVNPGVSVSESKFIALLGGVDVRLSYNDGDILTDEISCTFTYEVLPL